MHGRLCLVTVMTGFSGILTHWVHSEKGEMFGVSEVKDAPYDERYPTEECFATERKSKTV